MIEDPLVIVGGIIAPISYHELTYQQVRDVYNGCGPEGWGWLVPDHFRLIGLDMSPACYPHDYMYSMGWPKKTADNVFMDNGHTQAMRAYYGFRSIADRVAFLYYLAVKNGGAGAYNRSKK